jgi:hypothetical protein
MANRTVSHDRGDHIEVVVYRDGIETARTTKPKKERETPQPGDALEELLTSHGITKEWAAALKENENRDPACANRGSQLEQLLKVNCSCHESGEKNVPVYDCAVESIRRCLPTFHPKNSDRRKWSERKPESDIYQLCDACPHFSMKEKKP